MKFLIDTHTLIWFLENDPQLSDFAKAHIEDPGNEINVSIVSFWEIAIKNSIGKLSLSRTLKAIMEEADKLTINTLQINPEHILLIENLPLYHRDPFDRIIAAQCIVDNFSLIGRDDKFDPYFQNKLVSRIW